MHRKMQESSTNSKYMARVARQTKTAIYDLRDVILRPKEARVATGSSQRSLRYNAEMLARE